MSRQDPWLARYVAVGALALFTVVFVLVVAISLGGGAGSAGTAERERPATAPRTTSTVEDAGSGEGDGKLPESTYVVKPGDNLVRISERTGIPVEELQELNPDLDPQALVSGQKVRLRE